MATARERSGKRKRNDAAPDFVARVHLGPGDHEDVSVRVRSFTLAERDMARRAMSKLHEPDFEDWAVISAWVVLRRTRPDLTLGELYDQPFDELIELQSPDSAPPEFDDPEA